MFREFSKSGSSARNENAPRFCNASSISAREHEPRISPEEKLAEVKKETGELKGIFVSIVIP
jgi:hypothetical protein